jgi:hypothetical protein
LRTANVLQTPALIVFQQACMLDYTAHIYACIFTKLRTIAQ